MTRRASRGCVAAAVGLIALAAPAGYAAAAEMSAGAGGEDIRDIRGPKALFPWALALGLLTAGIALGGGGYALWHRRRHRPSGALEYFEIALQRLEELRALMRPATVREGMLRGAASGGPICLLNALSWLCQEPRIVSAEHVG